MIDVRLKGSLDQIAEVTPHGALCVQIGQHNLIEQRAIVDSSIANFYKPRAFFRFVIDGIIVNADKSVTASSVIEIYEATGATESTVDKTIIKIDILKNDNTNILNINAEIREGKFLNAKADDFNVFVTILGYYERIV